MTSAPQVIRSRDNPLLARLRRLGQDPGAYRRLGAIWLEGEHLCGACIERGRVPSQAVLSESGAADALLRALAARAAKLAVVDDALFAQRPCELVSTWERDVLSCHLCPGKTCHSPMMKIFRPSLLI